MKMFAPGDIFNQYGNVDASSEEEADEEIPQSVAVKRTAHDIEAEIAKKRALMSL